MHLKSAMYSENINSPDTVKESSMANRTWPSETTRKALHRRSALKRSVSSHRQIRFTLSANPSFLSLMAGNISTISVSSHRSYKTHKNWSTYSTPTSLITNPPPSSSPWNPTWNLRSSPPTFKNATLSGKSKTTWCTTSESKSYSDYDREFLKVRCLWANYSSKKEQRSSSTTIGDIYQNNRKEDSFSWIAKI